MRKPRRPRPYDASWRQQRAAESQDRALAVAERLFAARGYAETTMEAIATEAGIAVPTLYAAFQSKRGMLGRLLDGLVSGVRGASIMQTARAQEVLTEPDPRRALTLFAIHMAEVQARVGATYQVMKSAARTEADVAELYERAQRARFANLEKIAVGLAERGALRDGLSVEVAARTIWALASPEVRQLLVGDAGWTTEAYRAWLGQTLAAALLGSAAG